MQLLFVIHNFRNYRYAVRKALRKEPIIYPATLLTVPCKGIDNAFERNITSFFELDFDNYYLHFVVESEDDPAYKILCGLVSSLSDRSKAKQARVLIAGLADGCSQKIHNLLYSCFNSPDGVEVFAFADSDACADPRWLSHIVYPLRKENCGVSTGYRWFVPQRNNSASLALSAINAKVAQLLGNTRFNHAWGGSMAIRRETFYDIGLDEIWPKALSDDLSLSWAVKKNGMKIVFVPGCLVASYEKTTWPRLFEFARRQFLITRVITPATWCFGLFSCMFSLAGLWLGSIVAAAAIMTEQRYGFLYLLTPVVFLLSQMTRAYLRQSMIKKILPHDVPNMKRAAVADIIGAPLWSLLLFIFILSSMFGRTISWRGIRYKLISPTETEILT